jgi:hypothetical protein
MAQEGFTAFPWSGLAVGPPASTSIKSVREESVKPRTAAEKISEQIQRPLGKVPSAIDPNFRPNRLSHR